MLFPSEMGNRNQNLMDNQQLLEKLICSNCDKYLSVWPIKSLTLDTLICGRCSSNENRNFRVENLLSKHYFPCINRFEGCRKLLRHYEVEEHEKFCTASYHKCPICDLTMTTYELYVHFKKNHRESLTDNAEFEVIYLTTAIFMYYNRYNIFVVKMGPKRYFNTNTNIFYNKTLLSVVPICPDYLVRKIYISLLPGNTNLISPLTSTNKHTFLIKPARLNVTLNIEYNTITNEPIKVQQSGYNINQRRLPDPLRRLIGYNLGSWKLLKITGTKLYIFSPEPNALLEEFNELRINQKCALCHQYFGDSLCYDWRKGSFVCGDCASIQKLGLKFDQQATRLYSNLLIRCENKGCKKYYNLMLYLNLKHECYCEHQRRKKCPMFPICPDKIGLHDITTHFKRNHPRSVIITDDTVLTFENVLEMKVNYHSTVISVFVRLGKRFVQVICERIKYNEMNRHGQVESIKCNAYQCPTGSKVSHRLMKFSRENPVLEYFEATAEIRKGEGIKIIKKVI